MSNSGKSNGRITDVLPRLLEYLSVERGLAPATVQKYRENLMGITRDVGNLPVHDIKFEHIIALKAQLARRRARESRVGSVINSVKGLLVFARDILEIQVSVDPATIKTPRPPRREVVYLTEEEFEQFLQAILLHTLAGRARLAGYCLRALVETLFATGMRISEALSLKRDSIDFEGRRAVIIGKGNKERVVFFTDRALEWIGKYVELRKDRSSVLFATDKGSPVDVRNVEAMFRRARKRAKLDTPVTPHIIRHTTATLLLKNGCPIGYIKEILGHEKLETTCRYYLGILRKADAQRAHAQYLSMGNGKSDEHKELLPPPTSCSDRCPSCGIPGHETNEKRRALTNFPGMLR